MEFFDLEVIFSRENKNVVMPTKRDEDAGWDLYVDIEWLRKEHNGTLTIKPNQTVIIPTGIRTVFSKNYYIQIQERGSTGTKGMKYGAGVIDSNFRGVHNVVITNCNKKDIILYDVENTFVLNDNTIAYPSNKGIAQFVILPVPKVKMTEVDKDEILNEKSNRSEGCLGSSGK